MSCGGTARATGMSEYHLLIGHWSVPRQGHPGPTVQVQEKSGRGLGVFEQPGFISYVLIWEAGDRTQTRGISVTVAMGHR